MFKSIMYLNEDIFQKVLECALKRKIGKIKYLIMLGLNSKELEEFNKRYGDELVEKYKNEFEKLYG